MDDAVVSPPMGSAQATLAFHGAARVVTGSKYLLSVDDDHTLIDAGLFQGLRELRRMNWRPLPFDLDSVDRIVITHAHIDHIGYLPRLARLGYDRPVYVTPGTLDLADLLLLDAAHIQEEDARYANKEGYSKHDPAEPLYDTGDAKAALKLLQPLDYGKWHELSPAIKVRYASAGHILGSAHLALKLNLGGRSLRLTFSGDVGRYDAPLHRDPAPPEPCDVLICESTYGDRDHDTTPVAEQLADAMNQCFRRRGTVLIPAFAVGRSQVMTLVLREMMDNGDIPEVPIHIDSPMAVEATHTYARYLNPSNVDEEVVEAGRSSIMPGNLTLHRTVNESKQLNSAKGPRVILSASGMLAGGRVLHHLKRIAPDGDNLIVLAGFQAAGTRGRRLLDGEPTVRVHGRDVLMRCEVMSLHGLSGHADRSELKRWLRSGDLAPDRTYLTHGETESAMALAHDLRREFDWKVSVPCMDEVVDLERDA